MPAHDDDTSRAKPGEDFPSLGGPLDPANAAFHEAYARARDDAEREGPVLVLLGDELTLVRADEQRAPEVFSASSRRFHVLKVVAHVPVAAFALVHRRSRGEDTAPFEQLRTLVSATLASLADELPRGAMLRECRCVLERSQALLDEVVPLPVDVAEARSLAFAGEMGPYLGELLDHATRELLTALDSGFAAVLDVLDENERSTLHVVVAGAHQARDRSLAMQYFTRRLAEPEGDETRVTYAEAVETVDAALELIGTQRFDALLAAAFFGDEKRLQRDLLGDAAQRILDTWAP